MWSILRQNKKILRKLRCAQDISDSKSTVSEEHRNVWLYSDQDTMEQGWEFALSLIAHSLIRSFAHFAQDKWATVSDSLRSLRGNEYMSDSLKNFGKKKSKILFFSMFYIQIFEQRWVKLTDVLDSADSSSEMFWKAPNQAQRCSEQRWVKLRDVLDSAESS